MQPDWPQSVFEALRSARVRQVCHVPDAGHARLIELCSAEPEMRSLVLSSEQEGVALLAGAWLGGDRGVLLMQSSGVGNCINMLAMTRECRFPLLMLVTMRGEWGEFNPWQVPMGRAAGAVLEQLGVVVQRASDAPGAAEVVAAGADLAFDSAQAVAVLIGQQLVGRKRWEPSR